MRVPIPAFLLAGLAAGVAFGVPAVASTITEDGFALPELVAHAERICEVQVLEATPAMLADGTIETRYSFATITPIKGTMASIQDITMPGGEVAGRGLLLPGMPDLKVGDRSILFLSQASADKQWRLPVGLQAGAYQVQPAAIAGAAQVMRAHGETGEAEVQDYDSFLAALFAEVDRQG